MSTVTRRICAIGAIVTCVVIVACTTTEERYSAPGALPTHKANMAPQLNAATHAAYGELCERRGDLERAVEQYQQSLELQPQSVAVRNRLGVTLNKLGEHEGATSQFRRALVRHPGLAYLHNNLGFSLYLEQKYAEAEEHFLRALQIEPEFRRAQMNYALVLARQAKYDEAYEAFEVAVGPADAHYNVAVVQAEAGHYAGAAQSLELALEANPNLAEARDQLRQISVLAAREEEAEKARALAEEARLAAEEAELRRWAAEREAERLAAAEAARQGEGDNVEMAASFEAFTMPGNPGASFVSFWTNDSPLGRLIRVFDRIEGLLAVAEGAMPPPGTPTAQATSPALQVRLVQDFDDLLHAVATNAPWTEDCLNEWEQMLGLPDEWDWR